MTEEAVRRGPGRPRKNPSVEHEPKHEAKRPLMRAKPNWETLDPNADDTPDRFKLPPWFLAKYPEMAFQWVTDSIFGQPDQSRGIFEGQGGWTPVQQEDFEGDLNGRYMKRNAPGEINQGGSVLMARPKELHDKARKLDIIRARDQLSIKERALRGGDLPTTLDSRHPSAVASNIISKSYERIDVPKD